MSKRFITQYPLSPPMNDISNLYKKIRIQEQLQFFNEIIKKVKFKRPVLQPKKMKLPISVSSKTIQLKSDRSLSIRSPRILELPKKQMLPPISRQKASISGWEYKIDSEINQTLSSQRFSSINPSIKLLPKIQPIQTQSQPNSPVKVKSPNINYPTITATKMQIALIEQMHQTIRQKHFVQLTNTKNQKKQDNFSQTTLDEDKLLQYLN